MGFSKVELQVDSSIVVGLTKSGNALGMYNFSFLSRIWWLIHKIWEVKTSHTYREVNYYTYALVKYVATSEEDFSKVIRYLIYTDDVGSSTPRLIWL